MPYLISRGEAKASAGVRNGYTNESVKAQLIFVL
jgi:hypothetical protein